MASGLVLAFAALLVVAGAVNPGQAVETTFETITYASSADGTPGLLANIALVADGKPKPLLLVMHGYGGDKKNVEADVKEFAAKGVVAVGPDMRGTGGSKGVWDSGGKDVHDILDAALAALEKYPKEIDAKNLNVVGYSGGGGNAIACAVRFPDLFQSCSSFFGISDYAAWHASKGRPDCNSRMESALGGPPDKKPELYDARNANAAAANAQAAKLHFFWDELETACPPAMLETFLENHKKAGLANAARHVSKAGDPLRYKHGYRAGNKGLTSADDLFMPDVLAPKKASPALPKRGKLAVPGYLVTRHFTVWIGNAKAKDLQEAQKGAVLGQVTIEYDVNGAQPVLKVADNPKGYKVFFGASPLAKLP